MMSVDSLPNSKRLENAVIDGLQSQVTYFTNYRGFEVSETPNSVRLTVRGAEFDTLSAQQPSKSRDGLETRSGVEVLTSELSTAASSIESDIQRKVEDSSLEVSVQTSLNKVFNNISGDEVEFDLVLAIR